MKTKLLRGLLILAMLSTHGVKHHKPRKPKQSGMPLVVRPI
jgi:hypothetical protein